MKSSLTKLYSPAASLNSVAGLTLPVAARGAGFYPGFGTLGVMDNCMATVCHKVSQFGGRLYVQKRLVSSGCYLSIAWPCLSMLLSVWLSLWVSRSSWQGKPRRFTVYCLDVCCPANTAKVQCSEPVLAAFVNQEDFVGKLGILWSTSCLDTCCHAASAIV